MGSEDFGDSNALLNKEGSGGVTALVLKCAAPSFFLATLRASCGAVYCNQSCLFVGGFVTKIIEKLKIACIDPHQTGFVGKCSDHLQLIKFWPSHVPGRGSAAGRNFLAPSYYSQHAVFASPTSAFFI